MRAAVLSYKEKIRNQKQNLKLELKDMRKLGCNDEPFHLHMMEIHQILEIINSRKTPTPKTYQRWDKYAISFYLKMCTCFRVDYQHLEEAATSEEKKKRLPPSSTKEMLSSKGQEEHMGSTSKWISNLGKRTREKEHMDKAKQRARYEKLMRTRYDYVPTYLRGPFKMGSYSPGTEPDRIPYPLYLLVEEAVEIMKLYNNTNDLIMIDLKIVEEKIRFFCTYFNSHLPTGWKYNRANASSLIDGYDTTGGYRCLMAGYTPFGDWAEAKGSDWKSSLSPQEIVDVMSIIHSRKTPMFWGMGWLKIAFYCKLCSCFGIEYHRLEAAHKEKVCLMNVGRNGVILGLDQWYF